MKKLLKLIFNLLRCFIVLFVLLIVSVILIQRLSDNKVTFFGYSIYTVVTGSMVPKYRVGDMLLAKKVDDDAIQIGDDVVYVGNFDGEIVTHQVIRIEDGDSLKFHTKGINNIMEDPVIDNDQILGKVIMRLTILSFVGKVIRNPYFFWGIMSILIFIFVFFIVVSKKRSNH